MFKVNPDSIYSMWLERILENHRTQAWNRPLTAEEESADEWYHDHWEEMTEQQRLRLWGLSADLNSLDDNERFVDSDWPPATEEQLRGEQAVAFASGDWDKLLDSLRRPPRFRPRGDIDYARGRAWMELGHPDVAVLFFDNASRLSPNNLAYPSLALECLKLIPDWPKALARAEQYRQAATVHPRLLFRAGDVYHLHARQSGEREDLERAVEVVSRGLEILAAGTAQESVQSVIVGALATKALSLQNLGRRDEALAVFDEAVANYPDDVTLITGRGLLKQELGRTDALADLKEAAQRNSPLVWPYLELARDALRKGDYRYVLELC